MSSFEQLTQNVSELKSQAWDWVIRLDGDEPLSDAEKAEFKAWLSSDPNRIDEIYRLNSRWHQVFLTELADLTELKSTPVKPVSNRQQSRLSQALNPAAGFAFICLLIVSISLTFWPETQPEPVFANTTYTTEIGEQKTIQLLDNSSLLLDADSQVKVVYSDHERNFWLQKGEAHFKVAKNKHRPFNVYALNGRVQAVGTAFNVSLQDNRNFDVLVTEGKIALAIAKNSIPSTQNKANINPLADISYMTAGQYTSVSSSSSFEQAKQAALNNLTTLSASQIQAAQAWQSGELIFSGEPLAEVITKLKRYTHLEIQIQSEHLAQLKIGGRFEVSRVEDWVKSLEYNFNLEVKKVSANKIIIREPDR